MRTVDLTFKAVQVILRVSYNSFDGHLNRLKNRSCESNLRRKILNCMFSPGTLEGSRAPSCVRAVNKSMHGHLIELLNNPCRMFNERSNSSSAL